MAKPEHEPSSLLMPVSQEYPCGQNVTAGQEYRDGLVNSNLDENIEAWRIKTSCLQITHLI